MDFTLRIPPYACSTVHVPKILSPYFERSSFCSFFHMGILLANASFKFCDQTYCINTSRTMLRPKPIPPAPKRRISLSCVPSISRLAPVVQNGPAQPHYLIQRKTQTRARNHPPSPPKQAPLPPSASPSRARIALPLTRAEMRRAGSIYLLKLLASREIKI